MTAQFRNQVAMIDTLEDLVAADDVDVVERTNDIDFLLQ